MGKEIITIKNLTKKFGNFTALDNINLSIHEGEKIAILGGNGAGKTTLVEIIGLSTKQTSGEIIYNIEGNLRQEIGIQYQEGVWPAGISAYDMLKFYNGVLPNSNEQRQKELIEIFEIDEFLKKPLRKLSGGQKQRFNALLAVLNNPKFIILDELTTGLDMKLQFKIIDFLKNTVEKEKQALLLVSHSPEEAQALCERFIIIKEGKIIFDKNKEEIEKANVTIRDIMEQYFKEGTIKWKK